MGQLLSDSSSRGLADGVSQYVTVAHAHHVPLRIDEMNAISCGGQRGVSDVFGSALWAVDALFEMARVGVDGVNFHTVPDTINELIGMSGPGGGWHARVHPEYYGLMLFAQAAPARSRLLRTSSTVGSPIRVWATRATDGTVRVVLINPTTARPATVAVRVAGHGGAATLVRLQAPSVTARDGVTLGGQGFGASTDTGQLAGPARSVRVRSGHGGYVVRMPAASAALLTLPKPPT